MKIKKQLSTYLMMALAMVFVLSCEQNNSSTSDPGSEEDVKAVLREYKSAVEALNIEGTEKLFTEASEVYESGGTEGSYNTYMDHHLGPELKALESFKFNDYKVKVITAGDYAFGTETYVFKLVFKEGDRVIERKGVATSVLHKEGGSWKIMRIHGSTRAVRKKK
jgi:Domain of unknown function (DUF4440)